MTDTFASFRSARPKGSQPKELETAEAPAMEGEVPKDKLTEVKRAPRTAKAVESLAKKTRKRRALRYTIGEALEITAGLNEEDVALVQKIVPVINERTKESRKRIVAALVRVFR